LLMKKLLVIVMVIVAGCIFFLMRASFWPEERPYEENHEEENQTLEVPADAPFLKPVRITSREQAIARYNEWVDYLKKHLGMIADDEKRTEIEDEREEDIDIDIKHGHKIKLDWNSKDPWAQVWIDGPIRLLILLRTGIIVGIDSNRAKYLHERWVKSEDYQPLMQKDDIRRLAWKSLVLTRSKEVVDALHLNDGKLHAKCSFRWSEAKIEQYHLDIKQIEGGDIDKSWTASFVANWGDIKQTHGFVRISEKYGIFWWTAPAIAPPPPDELKDKVSKGKAIQIAREFASKVVPKHWIESELAGVAGTDLSVVHAQERIDEEGGEPHYYWPPKRRLAWTVVFYTKDKGKPDSEHYVGKGAVRIMVDAATGDILGGAYGI